MMSGRMMELPPTPTAHNRHKAAVGEERGITKSTLLRSLSLATDDGMYPNTLDISRFTEQYDKVGSVL